MNNTTHSSETQSILESVPVTNEHVGGDGVNHVVDWAISVPSLMSVTVRVCVVAFCNFFNVLTQASR